MNSSLYPAGGATKSCYKTDRLSIFSVNSEYIFVLGIDHHDSYFQHAILVLEDIDYYASNSNAYYEEK